MRRLVLIMFLLSSNFVIGQNNRLIIHDKSATDLLDWFEMKDKNKISTIATSQANQIMEKLYLHYTKHEAPPSFTEALKNFSPEDTTTGIYYGLRNTYEARKELKLLMKELTSVDEKALFERASCFFPKEYKITNNYNVFYTLTGWKWGDAMQFTYALEDENVNLSADDNAGIIFNIFLVNKQYDKDLEKKKKTFFNVFAHELFHAIYSDYGKAHPEKYKKETVEDYLKNDMFNEGMAHYISIRKRLKKNYKKV